MVHPQHLNVYSQAVAEDSQYRVTCEGTPAYTRVARISVVTVQTMKLQSRMSTVQLSSQAAL